MKPSLHILLIILGSAGLFSCEKPVDFPMDEMPELVVESSFEAGKPFEVYLSKTKSFSANTSKEYLHNAIVKVFVEGMLIEKLLEIKRDGHVVYISKDNFAVAGETYMLRIEAAGFGPVMAVTTVPKNTQIEKLEVTDRQWSSNPSSSLFKYRLEMGFRDPAPEENFYHLTIQQQIFVLKRQGAEKIITGSKLASLHLDPVNNNNSYIAHHQGGLLFDDMDINGLVVDRSYAIEVEIDTTRFMLGKIFVELRNVSKDYFLYHSSVSKQVIAKGQPIQEPVFVYHNIQNGTGIFASFNAATDSISVLN